MLDVSAFPLFAFRFSSIPRHCRNDKYGSTRASKKFAHCSFHFVQSERDFFQPFFSIRRDRASIASKISFACVVTAAFSNRAINS